MISRNDVTGDMFHNDITENAVDNIDAVIVSEDDPMLSCPSRKLQQVGEKSLNMTLE